MSSHSQPYSPTGRSSESSKSNVEEDVWERASRPSQSNITFDGLGACNTPHDACEIGNLQAFEKMAKTPTFNINKADSVGRTPLMWAAENGHDKLVRSCMRMGANVDKVDINQGRTALHLAARKGHAAVLKILIEGLQSDKRDEELNREDKNGITPIFLASQLSRDLGGDTMKQLIAEGARYNANKMTIKTAATVMMGALRWKRKGGLGAAAAPPAVKAAPDAAPSPPPAITAA